MPYGNSLSPIPTPGRRSGAVAEVTDPSFGTKSLIAIHLRSLPCCPAGNAKTPNKITNERNKTCGKEYRDDYLSVMRQRNNGRQVLAEIGRGKHPNGDPERGSNRVEQRETPP